MAPFNDGKKFGGGRGGNKFGGKGFGHKSHFGGKGGDRPAMHSAKCDKCGKACEVPFKPMGSKPVYCNDCFVKPEGNFSDRSEGRNSGKNFRPGRSFGSGDNFKPAYRAPDDSKKQFEMVNAKLDKILKMLTFAFTEDDEQDDPILESDMETEEKPVKKPKKSSKKK